MPTVLRKLRKAARTLRADLDLQEPKGGGSHWKFVDGEGKCYPVPAHGGLKSQVGDEYIRGLCRCFGIDLDDLKRHL
jgi:hypothetical protein